MNTLSTGTVTKIERLFLTGIRSQGETCVYYARCRRFKQETKITSCTYHLLLLCGTIAEFIER